MSQVNNRSKGIQGQNAHTNIVSQGQTGMALPSQGQGLSGMSPGHQVMQPSGQNSSLTNSQNMSQLPTGSHNQSGIGGHPPAPSQGMSSMQMNAQNSSIPASSIGGVPNISGTMPGMPDNTLPNSTQMPPTSGTLQTMQNHGIPPMGSSSIGPSQIQGQPILGVPSLPPTMPGASASPNLSGSQMAGGTMGPPNQSVDPSTSQSESSHNFLIIMH